jgi:chorismate mutase
MDEIEQLRREVDKIDDQIVGALSERAKVCRNIGLFKKKKGMQVRDNSREKEIYKRVRHRAAKFGLDPLQVEAVYHQIVNMCSAVQE